VIMSTSLVHKYLRLAGHEYRYNESTGVLERPDYLHGGWEILPSNFADREDIISRMNGTYVPKLFTPNYTPYHHEKIIDMRVSPGLIAQEAVKPASIPIVMQPPLPTHSDFDNLRSRLSAKSVKNVKRKGGIG